MPFDLLCGEESEWGEKWVIESHLTRFVGRKVGMPNESHLTRCVGRKVSDREPFDSFCGEESEDAQWMPFDLDRKKPPPPGGFLC